MKLNHKPILLFLIILATSCTDNTKESEQNFDWLLGSWVRANNGEDKTTFENWEKKTYLGVASLLAKACEAAMV